MKFRIAAIIFLAVTGSVLSKDIPIKTTTLVSIAFYYDTNLNGRQDQNEPMLSNMGIDASGDFMHTPEGAITVPWKQSVTLRISGISPIGKPLTIATYQEPEAVILLPQFTYPVDDFNVVIGLSDGYLTSPIRPDQIKMDDYNAVLQNPANWKSQSETLYPKGWAYEPNYFFYGYRIPSGGLVNTPHIAFDIWADPGTPVLASVPGKITEPLFDWQFGISGSYGAVYYNHIIPTVKIGDMVKRYDVIGYIAKDQGNHVHFELRPDPVSILEAFPGVNTSYFLKSPLKGERVPVPPFFDSE